MQNKKTGAAFAMMKDQMSLAMRYMGSARSMNNYLTAVQAYEKSLDILRSMLNLSGGAMGNDALTACRGIGDLLRSFNPHTVSLDRIVVFEYILAWRRTFDPSIPHPEESVRRSMKYRSLAFFDRGSTQRIYDARWKKLYEYAKNPNDKGLGEIMKAREKRYTAGRFWWFHNAVGKKYLDTISMPVYQLFVESKSRGDTINRKQGEIITIISSLKEEAKKEAKPGKKKGGKQVKKPVKKIKARKPAA